MRTIRIGALEFRPADPGLLPELIRGRSPSDSCLCLGFLNPHVYVEGIGEAVVGEYLARCEAVCLDGIGAVLAGSLLNRAPLPRMVMDQVFDACVHAGIIRGKTILLGLTPAENAAALENLRRAAPAAEFVGACHGFLSEGEYAGIFREHADADFVLVGMGTPKSERVLLLASKECRHALCWHVGGGTLRNWAGTKRRAPRIVSRMGLEWLHRAIHEPETRMRYLRGFPRFAGHVLAETLAGRERRAHRVEGGTNRP